MKYSVGPTRYADPREVPMGLELVRMVRESGLSLSALLEEINPSPNRDEEDAYERQLRRFNIRTADDTRTGIPASRVSDFLRPTELDGTTALAADRWSVVTTERFMASNQPQSWALFPEFINRIIRVDPLADDVLGALIALASPVDSGSYEAIYLRDTVESRQLSRVAEGQELPRIFAKVGFQSVKLNKYGAALEMTYEFLRRIRVPILTIILERVRSQIRLDQAAEACDVLVNGDGNNNAALNYNVSTLDTAAPAGPGAVTDPYLSRIGDPTATSTITKSLTYHAFLQWRTSPYPLGMTSIVGRMNELLQVLTLQMPNINPTMLLGLLGGGDTPMPGRIELPETDLWGNAQLVYVPFAPGGMLIGLNKDSGLEMLIETGGDLAESDKDILRQQSFLTLSQSTGFDRIIGSAVSTLSFQ